MKKLGISLVIGIVALLAATSIYNAVGNNNDVNNATINTNTEVSAVAEAIQQVNEDNVYVMDVRTSAEWNAEHAKGAMHWSLEERLLAGELPAIAKDATIYVYCRSGNRSAQSKAILEKAGYTNVIDIQTLSDWKAAGGPTASGTDGDTQG